MTTFRCDAADREGAPVDTFYDSKGDGDVIGTALSRWPWDHPIKSKRG